MPWEYLLDHTIGPIRLRIAATGDGFVVTKVSPGAEGQSVRIIRQRFATHDRAGLGQHCLAEALAAGEAESGHLRAMAQQAVRRAYAARHTMRAGSSALKRLEQDGIDLTQAYLRASKSLAHGCAEFEDALDQAGFPTGEREMPAWIARLFETTPTDLPEG